MWEYIEERVIRCAEYIVETGCTVRACSAHFSISKSTVHKDVSERLRFLDADLYEQVRDVLNLNLSERHIRGGIATRDKYKKMNYNAKKRIVHPLFYHLKGKKYIFLIILQKSMRRGLLFEQYLLK